MSNAPSPIQSIEDIGQLCKSGCSNWRAFGEVKTSVKGSLIQFNYTDQAELNNRWNYFEQVSRGLIIDANSGEPIARPFDKFFNWEQGGRTTEASINAVTEKLDGSLGVHYREGAQHKIATRSSFDSPQAQWASEQLQRKHNLSDLPEHLTLMFEVIYPGNRVVVDYGARESLALIGARDRYSGEHLKLRARIELAERYGFDLPKVYAFDEVAVLLTGRSTLESNQEGWVAEFEDGSLFKFKGEAYLALHRSRGYLSFKRILSAIAEGRLDHYRAEVPDEFLPEVQALVDEIQQKTAQIQAQAEEAFGSAPDGDRREFAQWARREHPQLSKYLFALLDGRPLQPLIYRSAFSNRS